VDWEDAHVRLEGRLARFARNSFEKVWHGSYPRVSLGSGRHQSLHRYRTLLLDGFPSPQFSRIKRAYLHLFSRARRRIRIIHAYLIPDRKVIRALKRAVRRGVDVEVIVPATSDVRAADWARAHVLARLLQHGIAVRRLAEPMLHTKAALADDRYVIVGSANLNRNSFFRNLEIVAWSHDMRLIEPIRLRFDMLWDKAVPYTLADHLRQSLWRRVQAWAAFRLQFLLPADQAW
jgi:cardiolipin synthase